MLLLYNLVYLFQFFNTRSRLIGFITFSLATIQISIIHVTLTKVSIAQSVSELHCN